MILGFVYVPGVTAVTEIAELIEEIIRLVAVSVIERPSDARRDLRSRFDVAPIVCAPTKIPDPVPIFCPVIDEILDGTVGKYDPADDAIAVNPTAFAFGPTIAGSRLVVIGVVMR